MLAHEKIRKSLASKSKGRGKSSAKIVKKPASPPKTSADVDLDNRFAAQYDRMLKDMDDRMELLSSSLLGQIRSVFDMFSLIIIFLRTPQHSRGNPVTKRCQSPLSHMTKSACVRSRERLVCEGGTGVRLSGLA